MATTTPPSKFLNYIHYFRGLAILFIVVLHVLLSSWNSNEPVKVAIEVVVTNSTILFVFIAGFLFHHLNSAKFNWPIYLKKKLLYVVLPYLLVSIPIIIKKIYFDTELSWWMTESYIDLNPLAKAGYMLVTGRQFGPFWFIPMIILFYLTAPLFLYVSRSKLSVIIPLIVIAGMFTVSWGDYSNIFYSYIHFVPVYLFGQWAAKNKEYYLENKPLFLSLVLLYGVMTILEYLSIIPFREYLELKESGEFIYVLNLSKLKALVLSIVLVQLFYRLRNLNLRFLTLLGNYSFGLYFLHLYAINLFLELRNTVGLEGNTLISFVVILLLVLALCLVLIFLTKKIAGKRSRYIIGS